MARISQAERLACSSEICARYQSTLMKIAKHICPRCAEPYPVWKVILCRIKGLRCHFCGARLGFSLRSSQRIGAVCGLVFSLMFALLMAIGRFSILSWWPLLPVLLIGSYLTGGVTAAFVGQLVPFTKQPCSLEALLPIGRRHRQFVLTAAIMVPTCELVLCCGRFVPLWMLIVSSLALTVAVGLAAIAVAHLLFGNQGVLRRDRERHESNQ